MKATALVRGVAVLLVAGVFLLSGTGLAEEHENLDELEARFTEQGLEPLPGRTSMIFESGVVGVFPGTPRENDEKPYVLIASSPPAGEASVGALVEHARNGLTYNGLPLPPLLASAGRHVIVAYFEDPGETGDAVVPLDEIAAYIDLSGLSEGHDDTLRIRSAASSPVWLRLIEQSNIPLGLDLTIEEAPNLGSPRVARFAALGIPGLQFEADNASSPRDTSASHVGASALAALIAARAGRLEVPPTFQRVQRGGEERTAASKRPYTGTIPAYTADVEGLLLDGVLPGGPAEEAGLLAGDVIVELAGTAIPDVYNYSDVLDSLEIDVPVTVVFMREGERRETVLTPRARE
jgi:hypothetical protein